MEKICILTYTVQYYSYLQIIYIILYNIYIYNYIKLHVDAFNACQVFSACEVRFRAGTDRRFTSAGFLPENLAIT